MTNSAPKLRVERQASPKVSYQHQHNHPQTHHHRSDSKSSPFRYKNGRHAVAATGGKTPKDGRQSPYSSLKSARNSPQQQQHQQYLQQQQQQQQQQPQQQQQQQQQQQRCEHRSPSNSPTSIFYAGAKFSETPSPASVPKPPSRWTNTTGLVDSCHQVDRDYEYTRQLRIVLNVQA